MEQLFIRLPSSPDGKVHWLVWSPAQRELIASGELPNAAALSQLADKSAQRETTVFVAGESVRMLSAVLPPSSQRMWAQLIPNALEDELAAEIESQHFAWPANFKAKGAEQPLPVATISHEAMQRYQTWLADAGISTDCLYPDFYMLPAPAATNEVSLMELGSSIIVRSGQHDGFCLDLSIVNSLGLAAFLPNFVDDKADGEQKADKGLPLPSVRVITYGPHNINTEEQEGQPLSLQWHAADIEVPLSVVANSTHRNGAINLLQQQYRVTKKRKTGTSQLPWKPTAIAAGLALIFAYGGQVLTYIELGQQSDKISQAIEQTYRSVVPGNSPIVNVRVQLQRKIDELGGESVGGESQALKMLADLQTAFAQAPDLQLELLRFENGQLRLQARASSFSSIENFRNKAEQTTAYAVEQGPVTNQDNGVSGTLIVRAGGQ